MVSNKIKKQHATNLIWLSYKTPVKSYSYHKSNKNTYRLVVLVAVVELAMVQFLEPLMQMENAPNSMLEKINLV